MNKILEIIMSISLLINKKENKLINMKNEEILFFLNTIYEQISLLTSDVILNRQYLASVACCSDDVKSIITEYQNDSNYNIVKDLKKVRNRLQGLMFGVV